MAVGDPPKADLVNIGGSGKRAIDDGAADLQGPQISLREGTARRGTHARAVGSRGEGRETAHLRTGRAGIVPLGGRDAEVGEQ